MLIMVVMVLKLRESVILLNSVIVVGLWDIMVVLWYYL